VIYNCLVLNIRTDNGELVDIVEVSDGFDRLRVRKGTKGVGVARVIVQPRICSARLVSVQSQKRHLELCIYFCLPLIIYR
jgi:hypothetical protein